MSFFCCFQMLIDFVYDASNVQIGIHRQVGAVYRRWGGVVVVVSTSGWVCSQVVSRLVDG